TERTTSSPPNPPPRTSSRCPAIRPSVAPRIAAGHPARTPAAPDRAPPPSATVPDMPRVSVLLPVRDAAPWLPPSLASLARQTLADHEVIAIDDGSRDGSGELLDRAALRDRRIVVRHTTPNGLPAALHLALSLPRAPWVAR